MVIELIFNIILGLLIVLYLFQALQMPGFDDSLDLLGANGFPQLLGFLALMVLLAISVMKIRSKNQNALVLLDIRSPEGILVLVNMGLIGIYILLLNILGFTVSTLLYLFIAPTTFGYTKWKLLAVFSLFGAAILVGIFGIVFYVPLPRGIGMFREISYLIY